MEGLADSEYIFSDTDSEISCELFRGGQTVALSHQSATEASHCATGGFEKKGILEHFSETHSITKFFYNQKRMA